MTHEAGKGDTQRPTNHEQFSSNYDSIFKKDKEVTCPECGEKFMLSSKYPHTHVCKPKATPISEMPQDFQDAIRKGLADGTLIPE